MNFTEEAPGGPGSESDGNGWETAASSGSGSGSGDGGWKAILTGMILTPIIVLGVLGNICSLLVWVKGRRRKTSTARYLSALAVADIIVLVTSALEFWIGHVTDDNIRLSSRFACKFFYYMSFDGPTVSAWILVAVTIERTMSVWVPHKINIWCRPVTAIIALALLILVVCVIYLPVLVGVDVVTVYTNRPSQADVISSHANMTSQQLCTILSTSVYRKYLEEWIILDLCMFFIIPYGILIVGNGLIMVKVVALARSRRKHQNGSNGASKSSKMLKTVTLRIVVLSVTFCACNAPISILNTMVITGDLQRVASREEAQYYRLPFHFLMYLNNAVNFLLYCVIGSSFRKDLIGILRRGGSGRNSSR